MKHILNIALAAALSISVFSACDDQDLFTGIPVEMPQQPAIPADGITATDAVANGGAVDLSSVEASDIIPLLNISRLDNFPADQELKIEMTFAPLNDGLGRTQIIDLVVEPSQQAGILYTAGVEAAQLDEAFKALISREPTEKTATVSYMAYAVQGTTTVELGAIGEPQEIKITPFAPDRVLESTYYIYGTATDGSIAKAIKLNHEGSEYDNPVFSVKVDITSEQIAANGGWKFKVVPQSTFAAGQTWDQNHNLTFIGAGDEQGTLAYATPEADCDWIVVDRPGELMLNVNILDQTYEITNAIEYMYVPGDGNGWSWSTKLFTSDYNTYNGYAYLTGTFKFTGTAGWNNDLGNYGAGGNNYALLNGSNDNFQVDGPSALYWLNVNLNLLWYQKTEITSIGVVGSHNDWDAANSTKLTPSDDFLTWEGTVTLADNDQFKFNMNGGWDLNLGGKTEDNLTPNGDNLPSPGAGTYLIVLDLSSLPYQCYLELQ